MKILLVGLGGYGDFLLQYFKKFKNSNGTELCAVVDPYAKSAPGYDWVVSEGIPVFDSIEGFFEKNSCDFAIASSPPFLHKKQCMELLSHKVDVLCEKPIVPTIDDLNQLKKAEKTSGKTVAVGFQWSYAEAFTELKKDILNNKFGKPISFKVVVGWPRDAKYYETSNWKGRIKDPFGKIVNDSIVSNATAHYLHNMLFLNGNDMDTSANFNSLEAELYRVKPIETFDTAFIKGSFENGATFLYIASHSVDITHNPTLSYKYENATITFDGELLKATLNDGTIINYGNPNDDTEGQIYGKISAMKRYVKDGEKLACTIKTATPHLEICQKLFDDFTIHQVPENFTAQKDNLIYMDGLYQRMLECYESEILPKIYKTF